MVVSDIKMKLSYLLLVIISLAVSVVLAQDELPQLLKAEAIPSDGLGSALEEVFDAKDVSGSFNEHSLFARQRTCPAYAPRNCGNGCCGSSQKCCPTSCCPIGSAGICCPVSMGGCCRSSANCVPSRDKCCPKTAETCGGDYCYESGAVCCNGGKTACASGSSCCGTKCCKSGSFCCDGDGCCKEGEKCCPGACCPSGYECGDTYGYCKRKRTATPTKGTKSATGTKPSKPKGTKPPKPKPKGTKPPKPKGTNTNKPTPSSCLSSTAHPQPTSQDLPVLEFMYVGHGIADDIPMNICLGIRHKLGHSAQEMVLTYAGDGRRCSRARGRDSGCGGCCSGVKKASGPNEGTGTQCDEFPFKSTVEGGTGAWIRCVTNWQNSLQGIYLNSWYSDNGIQSGDKFIVRVSNLDCATVKSTDLQSCGGAINRARQQETVASGSETAVHRTLDNQSTVVVAPFGDLEGGSFQATMLMAAGRLDNGIVIDSDGDDILTPNNLEALYNPDGMAMDWDLDGYVGGIGFIGDTESTNVNLTWGLVRKDPGSTSDSQSGSGNWGFMMGLSSVAVIALPVVSSLFLAFL